MRIKQLQKKLNDLDGWLTEDPIEISYLTGLTLSTGTFVCTKEQAMIFVDGRYTSYAHRKSPIPVGSEHPESFFTEGMKVGIDGQKMSVARWQKLSPAVTWQLRPNVVDELRLIKDAEEIQTMREAGLLAARGMAFVINHLKSGITEKELADELDFFFKKAGGEGAAFASIIAFGDNSAFPHHRSTTRALKQNEIVLIDIGATWRHYQSDMTRTLFFGDADPLLLEIHGVVAEAQRAALNLCKSGAKIGDLDKAARGHIEQKGYGPLFSHGLGHGIGLEVHEFPSLKNKDPFKDIALEQGMVVTIEPGIYKEGLGGVRLEDTIVITDKGYENLTCHVL